MDCKPISTAIRRQRRQVRLGEGPRICILCGCSDPIALIPKTANWLRKHGIPQTLLQQHHSAGQHHDPELTVLICRNCHAILHEGLLQAGVNMRPEPEPILRVATMLDALALFFKMLAAALSKWAELLKSSLQGRNRE